jgi:hypothetical protein
MKAKQPPAFAAKDALSPFGRAVPARDPGEIAADARDVVSLNKWRRAGRLVVAPDKLSFLNTV